MQPDLKLLYTKMLRSRFFEESVAQLWREGLISGEMHLGTGEEAIVAGVVDHLQEGDAMALDHRGTSPLLMRGVNPVLLVREFLGRADGLCSGMGGHMHLFSKQHLAASSGIVGASGPAAVGFALAALYLRPGTLAVAFFGEGATNQGMLMEAMNLAVVWRLPVLFVCKDNNWAITTESSLAIGGELVSRARGFGMPAVEVDGRDVLAVWHAAREATDRARAGDGPTFIHARCHHLEGHFLGFQLLRIVRPPFIEALATTGPLLRSALRRRGAPLRDRLEGVEMIVRLILRTYKEDSAARRTDPLVRARRQLELEPAELAALEEEVAHQVREVIELATRPAA